MADSDRWASLPERDRRGSRARCILLTEGQDEAVAQRLSALAAPIATIDPNRHCWMPRGFRAPGEAKLGEARAFLSAITAWWLAIRRHANTPNWDIVSTATIHGRDGLMLVEAKARAAEIKIEGKTGKGRAENHARIGAACAEANLALSGILPGWALSIESHYQLCNRFAWAWRIASLGVPVVLIYLGFIRADEMRDQGPPLSDAGQWERLVRDHSRSIAPASIWDEGLSVEGTPLHALIRSIALPLDGAA